MRFEYITIETLPKLAWCAVLEQDSNDILIYHGPWVETRESYFVDGGWDDVFENGNIDDTDFLVGTGGRILNGLVVFCTPSHPLERLYYIRRGRYLYLSPSMAFVLQLTGMELDIDHIPYHWDLMTLVSDVNRHIGSIPLCEGLLHIVHFRNIVIGSDLNVTFKLKRATPSFPDYTAYKNYLSDGLKRIADNFRSPYRVINFEPICTLSTGYDSTACAALATEIGCRDAVTFRRATTGHDDSGTLIGERLGMRVFELDRDDVFRIHGLPEAEFVAIGNMGETSVCAAMEKHYSRRFVILGLGGDNVWTWDRPKSNPLNRNTATFCDFGEFRWRVGFSIVPLPYFGCTSHSCIVQIGASAPMKPWSIGGHYDRPIPRRIAEEKGVDRSLFGRVKKATTIYFSGHRSMLKKLNPYSARSFEEFYQSNKHRRSPLKQIIYNLLYYMYVVQSITNRAVNLPYAVSDKYHRSPGRPSFLVHWGQSHIRSRYAFNSLHRQATTKYL
jgi:hypothetical protein